MGVGGGDLGRGGVGGGGCGSALGREGCDVGRGGGLGGFGLQEERNPRRRKSQEVWLCQVKKVARSL